MNPQQFNELKELIEKTTRETVEKRFDIWKGVLVTKLDAILTAVNMVQEVANLTNSDMGHDREALANARTEMTTIDQRSKEILNIASTQTSKIASDVNKHADKAVEKAAKAVGDNVEGAVNNVLKKIKNGTPLNGQKSKWKPWTWF